MLAHEAVEFLAVLGLPQGGHVLVERLDLFVETPALLFEAAQLLGAVLIEGGIAARVPRTAVPVPATRPAILAGGDSTAAQCPTRAAGSPGWSG